MQKIRSWLNKLDRISLKVLIFMLAAIVSLTAVFSYTSGRVVQTIYYDFFNDKTQLISRIVAAQINGDELLSYIDALRSDEAFKERQLDFYRAREELIELEKAEADSEDDLYDPTKLDAVRDRMRQFHREAARFKDANYFRIRKQLDALSAVSYVKYLYIFADTGIPGMYTYIFDARASRESGEGDENLAVDADDIGTIDTVDEFTGAETVFATKRQMAAAQYEVNDVYGVLYFTYAPLFDSEGNVAAVLGTDIDLSEMNRQIDVMTLTNVTTALFGSCFFILFFYTMMQRIVIRPIVALTDTAAHIEDGRIYTGVPEWILKKNDEMGLLGKALAAMTKVFQEMLTDTKQLFDAASMGRLDARSDPSPFKGDVAQVICQINDTLDIVAIYFESIPEVLFILSPRLELVFRNKRSSCLFDRLSTAEIVREILSADGFYDADADKNAGSDDRLIARWNEALRPGFYTASVCLTTPEAGNCYTFTCCDLILNGTKRGTLVVASDVTDLMREKAKAQSASVAKDEFLSRVSHELRSPMNVIVGMAQLGLKDLSQGETGADAKADVNEKLARIRERFEKIDSSSAHLLSIINDMLDMSRIEAGEIEIRHVPFDLRETVAACCDSLRSQAEKKHLEFTCRIAPEVERDVVGDGFRVLQILVNLLTNAVKFTEEGGRVTLSVWPNRPFYPEDENLEIVFSVEDTGVGMSQEFMQKIFTPFEQEDRYIQRRYQGTGLGLSICHRLVTRMGGAITAVSEPNSGSTFTFTLPFARAGAADSAPPETFDAYDFSGARMLLADDIELNRVIIREILADTHIDITEASDGAEALKLFETSEEGYFHIIFMDIQMPNMDGYQAANAIRSLNRKDAASIPIMAMTANAMQKDVDQALANGMNRHLSKPVDIEACLRAIAESLARGPQGF
jgi:signal transduction histidine kinase/ActR/RegA family two-component response regulator/HAMP domain-containing protein